MSRRFPIERSFKRRRPTQEPKFKIVIVCEGEITEPDYLESFARSYGNGLVDVVSIPKGGVPLTLVRKAIIEKKKLTKIARISGNSFDEKFQVWGMFDIDEHPDIPAAKDTAKGNGIFLAISNPCFELWGVLHYEKHNAPDGRHQVQRKLTRLMPGYHHDTSPKFVFSEIKDNYTKARANAIWLKTRREEEENPGGNPCSDVFLLLDEIIKNGKVEKNGD